MLHTRPDNTGKRYRGRFRYSLGDVALAAGVTYRTVLNDSRVRFDPKELSEVIGYVVWRRGWRKE